jgi:hypothetical protein
VITLSLAFLVQGAIVISPPAPTVGDTINIVRSITVPSEARARAQPLGSSLLVEPLADPIVLRTAAGTTVRYTVALFEPGRHAVGIPTVELLYRDGRVDVLPGDTAWVTVRSLLPAGDSLPPPKGSLAPIPTFPTRTTPLYAMVGLVVLAIGGWTAARWRVRAMPPAEDGTGNPPTPPVARWIAAGEGRAVAAIAADRLRERIAELAPEADRALSTEECIAVLEEKHPDWPIRDVSELLRSLERARFAPAAPSDVATLVDRVQQLIEAFARMKATVP